MIIVRVELHSAITGERTEIARAVIDNIGGTEEHGEYRARSLFGRSGQALDASWRCRRFTREGRVHNHPRKRAHVWVLVARALVALGYAPDGYDVTRLHKGAGGLLAGETGQ
jgi:hypothetical protein